MNDILHRLAVEMVKTAAVMTSVMTERIDHPEHGFRWRGERMEWAFARALHLIASHPEA